MVNAIPAKYVVQLGPAVTVETDAELTAWAELDRQSKSALARESIEAGLARVRAAVRKRAAAALGLSAEEVQQRFDEAYARALAEAQERADAQERRRADYRDRTARGETAMSGRRRGTARGDADAA